MQISLNEKTFSATDSVNLFNIFVYNEYLDVNI